MGDNPIATTTATAAKVRILLTRAAKNREVKNLMYILHSGSYFIFLPGAFDERCLGFQPVRSAYDESHESMGLVESGAFAGPPIRPRRYSQSWCRKG
jgi:hypothetical protein